MWKLLVTLRSIIFLDIIHHLKHRHYHTNNPLIKIYQKIKVWQTIGRSDCPPIYHFFFLYGELWLEGPPQRHLHQSGRWRMGSRSMTRMHQHRTRRIPP